MKTKIHVNQHVIKRNAKTGERNPTLTVKTYKSNDYAYEVEILGPSRVVYRPENPLPCGAKVWIETDSKVNIISELVCRIQNLVGNIDVDLDAPLDDEDE